MKFLLLIALAFVSFQAAQSAKVVCYYSSWAIYYKGKGIVTPSQIDPNLCTHVNYAFAEVTINGDLKIGDQWADVDEGGFRQVADLKKRNPNLKVLISVGGANAPASTFASIAASAAKRANFVKSARNFVQTHNFDGVDVDWEVPQAKDKANFVALVQDLKNDFRRNGWLVSAAVTAIAGPGYDVPKLSNILDMINVMIYDLYGPWSSYTGQNAALYPSKVESAYERANLNMDASVNQWLRAGAAPGKIVAGLAFYGHSFTLANRANRGLHAPIKGAGRGGAIVEEAGSISYIEYCLTKNNWQCTWDDEQKMPICVNGDQWLGFDNVRSITEKAKYIRSKGLGGAMVWSVDQDDVHGLCGGGAYPLLKAVRS